MPDKEEYVSIRIDQLQVGLFVTLDLGWMDHQFMTNSFKIRNAKQLEELKHLGLKSIRYSPARSDTRPLAIVEDVPATEPPAPPPPALLSAEELAARARKKERVQKLEQLRQSVNRCEKKFSEAAGTFKSINQNLYARPQESVSAATGLVEQMAASLLVDKDLAIHTINDKLAGEDVYFHSLNVAVLAMMLARELSLPREEISLIGLGALFHDAGKNRIPGTILNKAGPLTPAEENFLAQHPRYGHEIARNLKLPETVADIILHHHEAMDGSGYPDGLSGSQLAAPVEVVAIANMFDNLCNNPLPGKSMTPHEAVAHMYAKQKHLFEPKALAVFIRCMGIYPPGTLVQLQDEIWGVVVSVNLHQPLRPVVLIYDPQVPKEEAILVDLAEGDELTIVHTYRPDELPREVFEYLSPRRRITYYYDERDDARPRR